VNREQIEAGFETVRVRRQLQARIDDVRRAGFWRALNPELTISDCPFDAPRPRARVEREIVDRASAQIVEEGYLQTPPLVTGDEAVRLRRGIERVTAEGFPAKLACVYDEFYRAFHGLDDLFGPILGPGYKLLLQGVSAFCVPQGDPGYVGHGAVAPHRDTLGPDPEVLARRMPTVVSVWIPLTDVTTLESCLYVVPAPCDPGYHQADDDRAVREDRIRLQDIRALPARAGSVIAWSPHLIHWGSRSSRFAAGPRVAVSVYLQRADVPPWHPSIVDFRARVPFEQRLAWIDESTGWSALADRS